MGQNETLISLLGASRTSLFFNQIADFDSIGWGRSMELTLAGPRPAALNGSVLIFWPMAVMPFAVSTTTADMALAMLVAKTRFLFITIRVGWPSGKHGSDPCIQYARDATPRSDGENSAVRGR
jgi:hypothetical protein